MQISLNELVAMLADRVGQPFNTALQEEMKVVLNYKRADYFRKLLQRNPRDRKYYLKYFEASLTGTVPKLVTEEEIPLPVRTSFGLYDYIGPVEQTGLINAYGYATPEQIAIMVGSRYTGSRPRYVRNKNKVEIHNAPTGLDKILVGGVFADPRELLPFRLAGDPIYTDNDRYEIPDDIVNAIIVETLRFELNQQFPEPDEVQVNEDNPTKN